MTRSNHGGSYHAPKKKASVAKASCSSFKLKERHEKAVEKTKSFTVECMPDYRRRVMKLVRYVQEEYADEADELVRELSPEEKSNPRYHYHNATHDFRYDRFPPAMLQSFMSDQWRDGCRG